MIFTFTNVGLAAVTAKANQGLKAVIAELALGDASYEPSSSQTSLQNERQRAAAYGRVTPQQHTASVQALFVGPEAYAINEAGAFLDDGTLLGVWSKPGVTLAHKVATDEENGIDGRFLADFTIGITPLPAESISIDETGPNLGLYYAPEFAAIGLALVRNADANFNLVEDIRQLRRQATTA